MASYETTAAFRELLDVIRDGDQHFFEGFRALPDEAAVVEGYRFLVDVFSVALDIYVTTDSARPELLKIVSPTRKFGGDNADAYYYFAPIDPTRTYRVHGRMGDAVYLSLCVYGGPTDGRWSNRIVSKINNREMTFGPHQTFEVVLGGPRRAGNWIPLDEDAVALVTRDYLIDPVDGTSNFVRRVPIWATLISLMDGDDPVVEGYLLLGDASLYTNATLGQGVALGFWQAQALAHRADP
jgi:hypothetical protein